MKKIFLLLAVLTVAATLLLTACGGDDTTTTTKEAGNSQQTTVTSNKTPTSNTTSTTPTSNTTATSDPTSDTATTTDTTPTSDTTPVDDTTPIDYGTPNVTPTDYTLQQNIKVATNDQSENELDYLYGESEWYSTVMADSRQTTGEVDYIIYKFDISQMYNPTFDVLLLNYYRISISGAPDRGYVLLKDYLEDYYNAVDAGPLSSNEDGQTVSFNAYEKGLYKEVYIKIEGCQHPNDEDPTLLDYFGARIRRIIVSSFLEPGSGSQIDVSVGSPNNRDASKTYTTQDTVVPTNGSNQDKDYIFENMSQVNGTQYRYCDKTDYIIYMIDISQMIEPTVTIKIKQNYVVDISSDNEDYTNIANYANLIVEEKAIDPDNMASNISYNADTSVYTLTDGSNETTVVINPYENGIYNKLFIKISDTDISNGWGGTIVDFTITEYVEG